MKEGFVLRSLTALTVVMILAGYAVAGSIIRSDKVSMFALRGSTADADGATWRCLECHDGVVAKDMGYKVGAGAFASKGSHPVGVSYASSARKSPRMYTPTALLDDRVPLVDGRVSCTSCHVLKKDELLEAARGKGAEIACEATAELTVNNAGSALCMSCHSL